MGKIGYAHGEGKTILLSFLFSFCRVENSLFGFLSELLVFCEQKSRIVIRSFPKSDSLFCSCLSFVKNYESKLLPLLFKKERQSEEQREWFVLGHKKGKSSKKHGEMDEFFLSESLIFRERKSKSLITITSDESKSLSSLFCKEWQEQVTHGHSFLKRGKCKSLMIPL